MKHATPPTLPQSEPIQLATRRGRWRLLLAAASIYAIAIAIMVFAFTGEVGSMGEPLGNVKGVALILGLPAIIVANFFLSGLRHSTVVSRAAVAGIVAVVSIAIYMVLIKIIWLSGIGQLIS